MLPRHCLLPLAALSLALTGCSGGGEDAAETKPAAAKRKGGKPHINHWAKDDPNAPATPAPAPRPAPKPTPNPWAKKDPNAAPSPAPAPRPAPKPTPNPWASDQPGTPKE